MSDTSFAAIVSLLWLVMLNGRFWSDTIASMWHGDVRSVVFLVSLFVLAWAVQAFVLLLMPTRRLLMAAVSVLFLIGAIGAYFCTKYGIVVNKDMLRNVVETNTAESLGLLSSDLIVHVLVLGALPALLVWRIRMPAMRWSRRLRIRGIALAALLAVCVAALLSASASYAVFFREHKPIRFTLMPAAPVFSAVGLLVDSGRAPKAPLVNVSGSAQRIGPVHQKPLAIILVVGETARAANFQLGGYPRATNPELIVLHDLVYFRNTTSCGTATAVSVPCMFSHLPRNKFNVNEASRYANALDALQEAGLSVEWRDNNAGCKGVCDRVPTLRHRREQDTRLCREGECYDEILLQDLAARLDSLQHDTVIVLHQIGSHGPAYSERYPPQFEQFAPACHSNQLQRCTTEEVVNAYDNTIRYTDHVLASAIRMLRHAGDRVDGLLMYVSDHGESLGEQGLYLHGLPYAFAPDVQKHVPMLMWLSESYAQRTGTRLDCLQSRTDEALSHDNLYHTLLGASRVHNASYDPQLDLLSSCRRRAGHE